MKNRITHIYPATSLQQGFIYHALSQPDDDAYQIQTLFDYNDRLDVDKYLEAWRYCIARYPSLRTAFNWEEEPLQVVYKEGILNFELHNISDLPSQELRDMEIEKIRLLDRSRLFDLTRPSLFRLHIIKQSEECYTILRNVHHSISDGWSTPILLKNLQDYYLSLVSGEKISVEEDQAYLDTQEYIAKYKSSASLYWEECLSGVESANDINGLLSRPVNLNNYKRVARSCETSLELGGDFYKALKKFSLKEGITVNAIVQFVWHKLLQVYSGLEYSVVGTTVSGRSLPVSGITDSVGLYINTLPLVVNWTSGSTILEELHHIQHQVNDLNAHSYSDLAKLQRSGIRLFHSLFVYNNYSVSKGAVKDVSKFSRRGSVEKIDYPLCFTGRGYNDVLTLNLGYDGECLSEPKADSHMEDLRYLLEQVVYHSDQAHDKITLLRGSAYQEVVYDWNATDAAYDMGGSLVSLFEAQVAESPDAVALVYEGEMLTYGELNAKSNQLARHLRRRYKESVGQDLSSDILIALCLDRSLEMIIGILGVLKAGGAYVPMDPGYPQNRIDFILGDTSSSLILTNSDVLNSSGLIFPQEKLINIRLDASFYTDEAEDSGNLGLPISSDSLAYVIYTSGTTGKPKGVMVEHGNITELIINANTLFKFEKKDVWVLFHSYVFDFNVWEQWGALINGSRLVIPNLTTVKDSYLFYELCKKNHINILNQTPSAFYKFLDIISSKSDERALALKYIIFGGEQLNFNLLKKWHHYQTENNLVTKLINMYGITETTVHVTFNELFKGKSKNNIGRPLSNTKVYVLDNSGHPVPVGVAGELYIGGAGVSRGYLNREALTSERFVLNRFASKSDRSKGYDRLYKTGDLVRWHSDGNLEYLGRNDDQVKIRGYRIELGEIESALSSIGGVSQSCVLSKERTTDSGESKYLVGYYVLEEGSEELTEEYLLEALSSLVPDYMIPSRLIVLEQFPLTVNGKLDRRSLPEVESLSGEDEYVAPQSETERSLCKIWEEVLGVSRVGVTDNFFRIGGDSILSIRASHRMSEYLDRDLKVSDIFSYQSISRLLRESLTDSRVKIPKTDKSEVSLSFAQERLWFIEQYAEGSNAYHIPVVMELSSGTDVSGIKYALDQVVSRHEILRSRIIDGSSGNGIQIVDDNRLSIEEFSLASDSDYESLIRKEIHRPFDLAKDPPIRVHLYYIDSSQDSSSLTLLFINVHHIASDGWSTNIFKQELNAYYNAYLRGDKNFSLPALEIQYKDYAQWQRSYLSDSILSSQLDYWKSKLSGFEPLELLSDYPRPSRIDYRGANIPFHLSADLSKHLRSLARDYGVTLQSILLGGLNVLLYKYTGQDDIVIGNPIANRHHEQTQNLIGFFVNTLVNRSVLRVGQSYESLIKEVHQDQVAAQHHQDLPFERLIEELGVPRDSSRHPVFQIFFDFHSFDNNITDDISGLNSAGFALGYEVAKFDLSFYLYDNKKGLKGKVNYATSLFKASTIEVLLGYYIDLLEDMVASPGSSYSDFKLLRGSAYQEVVYDWNATDGAYDVDASLVSLFEAQVAESPDAVALVYEGEMLTYGELNAKSNQLARHLRRRYKESVGQDLSSDILIALCLDRSLEMIIGILGVLKAGGAYVPMDPGYPQNRIDFILGDTSSSLILTNSDVLNSSGLIFPQEKLINIRLDASFYTDEAEDSNLGLSISSDSLAYVIYTSGTTGKPKGVMVEHRNVSNIVKRVGGIYKNYQRISQFSTYTFDVSVSEIFSSLFNGLELHILSNKLRLEIKELSEYINLNKIELIYLPVTILEQLPYKECLNLKAIIYAGESCSKSIAKNWSKKIKLFNFYGPTETSIYSVYRRIFEDEVELIGRPLSNTKVYVLDNSGHPVPVGVAGELYIGGAGVSRGYLNREALTSERFVLNRFASKSDRSKGYDRLYKTGDLVRWHSDGNLEYLGRNDDQVKIRGYRIELGEIESALSSIGGVSQSCVLSKERTTDSGESKYLVGYYVLEEGSEELTEEYLLEALSSLVPDYMIPSRLIVLEQFPLTVNGKLDRRSLPEVESLSGEDEYVAPQSETERSLCKIWEEVLGVSRVGVTDNFFRIGGDSILSIRASHRMSEYLDRDLKVSDIFSYQSISRLLRESLTDSRVKIPKTDKSEVSLSFAQERLWFIEQYAEGSNAYHIPVVMELSSGTDVSGIKYALDQVVSRHEILRSRIIDGSSGNGIQIVDDNRLSIEEFSLASDSDYESLIRKEIHRPFDLAKDPPIRVHLYYIDSSQDSSSLTLLFINVHHIASDGWSTNIFKQELNAYYNAYLRGDKNFSLPALEIQYKDYAQWQRSYLSDSILSSQLDYWKSKLSGFEPLELLSDYPRPSRIDYRGANIPFHLSADLSKHLRSLARDYGVTLQSILLGGLNVLLYKYTGQDDIVIGNPIANRHHEQTQNLIGFFVNTLVNRSVLRVGQSYESLIKEVHQDQVAAQHHQDLPFERLIEELGVPRDSSRPPVFQIWFDFHNFDKKITKEEGNYLKNNSAGFALGYEVAKFDLSFYLYDNKKGLKGKVNYATSLFKASTIEVLLGYYIDLLEDMVASPGSSYSDFKLLRGSAYQEVVYDWNATDAAYDLGGSLVSLFEAQVAESPDAVALVYEGEMLTYGELNAKSNQLARHIRSTYYTLKGEAMPLESCIGLYLERGFDMVISMLGVLKAGGAYVPIDPDYPADRVRYILEDSGSKFILTQTMLMLDNLSDVELPSDLIAVDLIETEDSGNLGLPISSDSLAYVIYTSGTTGKPKGVMVEHKSVAYYLNSYKDLHPTGPIRVCSVLNYCFDASVPTLLLNVIGNSTVHILNNHYLKNEQIVNYVNDHQINSIRITPSMLEFSNFEDVNNKLTVVMGGERFSILRIQTLLENQYITIYNQYGPTECTVGSTVKRLDESVDYQNIGKGYPSKRIYVLDNSGHPVPVGVAGELYIGGAGVSRGYLNREALTSERFVLNRFASKSDRSKGYDRLYKTGDLVRWHSDGNLEYLGRNDDQVKIRGYRIELGEIESALSSIGGVSQSCVLSKERTTDSGESKYLVGYYVLEEGSEELTEEYLLEALSSLVPDYMIPSRLIVLEQFPLTVNGKLDRRSLPEVESLSGEDEYVAPQSETERSLCKIWEEVLGVSRVGVTDDFFRLGGDSILSIRASHQMSEYLDKDVSVADIFGLKRIDQILKNIHKNKLVKKYYETYNFEFEDIVLVHPGGGGIEVYQNLAEELSKSFNCIGIDNYNLYNNNKINSLEGLSEYYLNQLSQEIPLRKDKMINFLSWSFGGLISIKMVSKLEDLNYKSINLFLLDTFIKDNKIIEFGKISGKENKEKSEKKELVRQARRQKISEENIKNWLESSKIQSELGEEELSVEIENAKVILFKAMNPTYKSDTENSKNFQRYLIGRKYNNIDKVAKRIKVIELKCKHIEVLDKESEKIIETIYKQNSQNPIVVIKKEENQN